MGEPARIKLPEMPKVKVPGSASATVPAMELQVEPTELTIELGLMEPKVTLRCKASRVDGGKVEGGRSA
jgi:hypothetical protein